MSIDIYIYLYLYISFTFVKSKDDDTEDVAPEESQLDPTVPVSWHFHKNHW